MPYSTHWHPRGIVWEFSGDVTAAEIEAANEDFYRDERSDHASYQVIDARSVTSVEWAERDIQTTAAHDVGATYSIQGLKIAYIAEDPTIVRVLEKYAELMRMMSASWTVRGFSHLEEAMAWVEG